MKQKEQTVLGRGVGDEEEENTETKTETETDAREWARGAADEACQATMGGLVDVSSEEEFEEDDDDGEEMED